VKDSPLPGEDNLVMAMSIKLCSTLWSAKSLRAPFFRLARLSAVIGRWVNLYSTLERVCDIFNSVAMHWFQLLSSLLFFCTKRETNSEFACHEKLNSLQLSWNYERGASSTTHKLYIFCEHDWWVEAKSVVGFIK